jgi:hypothetical protein
MPNWCLNKLTVSHTDNNAMDRFVVAYNKGTLCNEFLPMPENIGEGWYDWCVSHWGTKWDVGADEGTEKEERYGLKATVVPWNSGTTIEASCSFDSAWAPPIGLYNKLVELGYDVHASYFEPGMSFCGVYHNGMDNYIEYTSKDMIPVGISNDFNLEEFFEEV